MYLVFTFQLGSLIIFLSDCRPISLLNQAKDGNIVGDAGLKKERKIINRGVDIFPSNDEGTLNKFSGEWYKKYAKLRIEKEGRVVDELGENQELHNGVENEMCANMKSRKTIISVIEIFGLISLVLFLVWSQTGNCCCLCQCICICFPCLNPKTYYGKAKAKFDKNKPGIYINNNGTPDEYESNEEEILTYQDAAQNLKMLKNLLEN